MFNSKLINFIKSLHADDLDKFENFLASPYCNRNKKAIELLTYIRQYAPNYDSEALHRDVVFAKIFPKKEAKGYSLTQLMSDMTRLLKEFLGYENYKGHAYHKQLSLMDELVHRNNMGMLRDEFKNYIWPILGDSDIQDSDFFYCQYRLEEVNFTYHIRTHNRDLEIPMHKLIDSLDTYIMVLKLRNVVSALTRQRVLNQEYSIRWENIVEDADKLPFKEVALIQLYAHFIHILKEQDADEHYKEMRQLLSTEARQIEPNELLQLYSLCLNYEVRLLREDAQRIESIVSLCREMEENGLFEKHIQNVLYTLVVKFAAQYGNFEWANNFLNCYKDRIAVDSFEERGYIYNYSSAILYFYKGEYKKAKYLLGKDYPDAYYYAERKAFLLKIYYHMEDLDEAGSELKALEVYLKRDKSMTDNNKKSIRKFMKAYEKLGKLRYKTNIWGNRRSERLIQEIDEFDQYLQQEKPIYELSWLEKEFDKIK